MAKKCVVISGPTISADRELSDALSQSASVWQNSDNEDLSFTIKERKPDLALIEIAPGDLDEIGMIKELKSQFPLLRIILLDGNGDCEVIASAFQSGVDDAFRKPYNRGLIAERVTSMLKRT